GVGVRPRTALATTAGLAQDDGIVTDAAHRTSHPAAWAAGDVARVDGRRIEHWHAAREGGERAAASMLDLSIPAPRAPWLFSEVAGTSLDVFGSASEWDEAQWVRPASVLAYVSEERIVQIAAIGGAIAPDAARALVERGAGTADLERHLSGA
ncbi:MAG: FAD-dependent oxidoreductase, partial [Chloroflexi bacterium]|nr:FAD-dependent oxidoreductase [Chloroflexota bacterium]